MKMKQPELGKRLAELRQERNMTQEELVEACNVSVRTIQRIESGEVTPRTSTVKILLAALGEDIQEFDHPSMSPIQEPNRNWLQAAWIAGIIYLIIGTIEGFMDYGRSQSPFMYMTFGDMDTTFPLGASYVTVKIISFLSYILFAMGFVQLANMFKNHILKVASILLIAITGLIIFIDIFSLFFYFDEANTWVILSIESVISGAIGIVFGVGLFKLQDGMGRTALLAGVFEMIIGGCFVVVILFFLGFILIVPTIIIEIILLYKGFELVKKEASFA